MNRKGLRDAFLDYVGQTSSAPLGFAPMSSHGIYINDHTGKKFIDLIAGISVSNLGHSQPRIVEAIQEQAAHYVHSMVYGEHIQSPQVLLAKRLADALPDGLDQVYFVSTGSEAVEGAMKLAKRTTGRQGVVAFRGAYHGNTHATMGLMDNPYYTEAYRPFVPGVRFLEANAIDQLQEIDESIACVVMETIRGAMGYRVPNKDFVRAVRHRCDEVGAILILDEIQAGLGRTGRLWGFEHFDVVPDILCLAKALGGGMPLGAFITDRAKMKLLTENPVLGHISTFGGNAVCCAAGLAAFNLLIEGRYWEEAEAKGAMFKSLADHPLVTDVSGIGLMLAVDLIDEKYVFPLIDACLHHGVLTDGFLHNLSAIRIAPPLTITPEEIQLSCDLVRKAMDDVLAQDL